jgi:hypothetical protein
MKYDVKMTSHGVILLCPGHESGMILFNEGSILCLIY